MSTILPDPEVELNTLDSILVKTSANLRHNAYYRHRDNLFWQAHLVELHNLAWIHPSGVDS